MFPITVGLGLAFVAALCFACRPCGCNCDGSRQRTTIYGPVDLKPVFRVDLVGDRVRIFRNDQNDLFLEGDQG